MLLHLIKRFLHKNVYLILGISVGILLFNCNSSINCKQEKFNITKVTSKPLTKRPNPLRYVESSSPSVQMQNATRRTEKVIRPRYYSTELGIREKLFVGVFTSEDKVNTQAIYINKTITHVVDKVKFFITVRNKMKSTFNLSGIVGFTDTRYKLRTFQVIKYIGDTFMQDYDYYFLMNDYNFLNVRKLKDVVDKISVSSDVYLGTTATDSSFCNLDAGVLLSNSVLKAMKENLDWCILNAISEDRSENFGRCVHYSINLECQNDIQGQEIKMFKLKHFQLDKRLKKLTDQEEFRDAVTVYPILRGKDYYLLNAYFSRLRLEELHREISALVSTLTDTWPPGQRTGAVPATRFDLPSQHYFNMTHMFFPDHFTNVAKHNLPDLLDIEKIMNVVKTKFLYQNYNFQFRRLINGYRTFDLSRGLEYILDLGFRDLSTGKEIVKRFEVCKPLGRVEFVSVPYVTENPRVTILLPVEESQIDLSLTFVEDYKKNIMEHKSKALLMLILLYQYDSSSKGVNDKFAKLKEVAVKLSDHFRSDDNKIVWVSIRLPQSKVPITMEEYKALKFATVDLSLKKIGLESLVLILDVHADISPDFLNRVRMNTILGYQIFNPIPFRQYNPKLTHEVFEITKNAGHFDRENYKYLSFYGKDYVFARKQQNKVPLIRTDNDILQILDNCSSGNILEMFIKSSNSLHLMRATEKDLKIKYYEDTSEENSNLFLGTKVQLGKIMLGLKDKMSFSINHS